MSVMSSVSEVGPADAEAAAAQAALATAHASGNATETTHNHADTHEHSGGHGHSHGADGESGSTHGMAGFVMVAGFLFQMLVDKLLLKHGGHAHGSSTADGFAMGAASAAGNSSVELLVFAAIMLHKGPAAFGLVAFLLSEGLDKRKVKEYLLAFSFAAPVMAIVTFVLIKVTTSLDASTELGPGFGFSDTLKLIEGDANGAAIPQGVSESQHDHAHDAHGAEATQQTSSSIIGLALLFSAGTFLYVATIHVLPELTSKHGR
ncbi:hypothetical protein SARC_10133 [Sphaeroforma arctica JP610]|uniref:Zinc/iron permease n=1 Tax=Sphaeroforma arctica JP610 TaxID=667725 RepID=A0A0L0FKT9_9EUKA|nr:hypothetical protein SARC_10133 [Sphaeroforma arctica JP610]KNC77404.1 hypothetical protein SARC_10133 [Sphaeroforma arctica JP610]|eukprot:XP_014151306.1 hypothetical protein SARC_10133 [Sphaeroforma arctica JP610]